MARIDRSEYPAIAQFVADGMNVPEIAAQFECTPANIYLIVSKIRNGEAGAAAAKLLAKAPAKGPRPPTPKAAVQGSPRVPAAARDWDHAAGAGDGGDLPAWEDAAAVVELQEHVVGVDARPRCHQQSLGDQRS